MPKYRITGPDGANYEVDAPEGASEHDVMAYVQSQASQAAQPASPAPPLAGNGPQINYTDPGYKEAIAGQPKKPTSGMLWPVSIDEKGKRSFDPNAGIVGVFKRAAELPGKAVRGEFDPMSREAIPQMMESATVMSPLSTASRASGVLARPSAFKTIKPPPPSRAALAEATTAGYRRAANMGVEYDAAAVKRFAGTLATELEQKGYISELAPEAHALLNKLRNPPEGATSVRLQDLDAVRKVFGKLAGNPDPTKASVASQATRAIDDFMASADPANVVPRTATAEGTPLVRPGYDFAGADARATSDAANNAARTIAEARGNAAAGFRSDKITGLENKVDRRAAAANSGRNFDNSARQRLNALLDNRKDIRGFSPEEQLAIADIVYGKPTKNAARYVGNLFGGGGGLGQFLTSVGMGTVGGAAGGSIGAVAGASLPTAIGALGKAIANRLSRAELKHLDEIVRARSPLGKQTMTPSTVYTPRYVSETLARGAMGIPVPNRGRRQ